MFSNDIDSKFIWKTAPSELADDGKTLKILGKEVMQVWETEYMSELAQIAVMHGGRVLEVGFGMGISAKFIKDLAKSSGVTEHVIVEANESVFTSLKAYASEVKEELKVTPILGFWEDVLPTLQESSFDGILFDPYPIDLSEEADKSYSFAKESLRLLKPGGVFTYYSNEPECFSEDHERAIRTQGWDIIEYKAIPVSPPENCEYWKWPSIMVPRLFK